MKRWKLWIFGVLAVAGTAGGVVYAVAVAPGAKTKFEAAVLFFTAAAAVTGFLGLIVSWLSYRLEAGRVPKPDLAIVSDGELVRRWDLEIELLDPEPDGRGRAAGASAPRGRAAPATDTSAHEAPPREGVAPLRLTRLGRLSRSHQA